MLMAVSDPLSVFLVSSGSRGDRLLFRYPYESEEEKRTITKIKHSKNPFALKITEDYKKVTWPSSNLTSADLIRYSDDVIGHLLAVKPDLCGNNFEIKINDIIFVGYPVSLQGSSFTESSSNRESSICVSFHVLFALKGSADQLLIQAYCDLTKELATALKHEEQRCGYFSQQKNAMWAIQDEISTYPEDSRESSYAVMLQKVSLAKKLKATFDGLCTTGVVQLHINRWVKLSFCLPHKVHNVNLPGDINYTVTPEVIQKCIKALRPYHGMLLLVNEQSLRSCLPMDSNPALARLITVTTPLKSLYQLASDADLSLGQVYKLVLHLVYWGKATVIYPLCETNVYILSPNANTCVNSSLVEKFVSDFPGMSLPAILSEFSLPTPLGEHGDILGLPQQQAKQVQMVIWLLRHRLLMQLHTYIFLMTKNSGPKGSSTSLRLNDSLVSPHDIGLQWPVAAPTPLETTEENLSMETQSVDLNSHESAITDELSSPFKKPQGTHFPFLCEEDLSEIPAARNPEDFKLFKRLCPYFNGLSHLEEIMYYENLHRSQLLTVLDKFREILGTCQHGDPGITSWSE